jgi:hypothetical protein
MSMNNSSIRSVIIGASALLLAACQTPTITDEATDAGLAEVRHSGMDSAQADPRVNFADYRNIVIEDIGFDQLKIVEPSTYSPRYGKFMLDDADKTALRKSYRERVGTALTKGGAFTTTDTASAGSLRLVSELVKLEPNAPREKDERFGASARSETFTRGAGSLTLEAKLIDAASGNTVATLRDKITDAEVWGDNNPVSNRAAVQRAFTQWATKLRAQLQAFSTR